MFEDDDHKLMHAGEAQASPAVAVLEKWSVAEWGWDGSDRLYMWTRNRRAGLKTWLSGCGPRKADRTGRGQEGRAEEWKQVGLKWQVSARLIFHPSHGPFVVESNQKYLDWIWLQEHRWMCSHADTCAHLCIADKNIIHQIKWQGSLGLCRILKPIHTGQMYYLLTEACISKLKIWAFFLVMATLYVIPRVNAFSKPSLWGD